mgnify:CR=1 FL=1
MVEVIKAQTRNVERKDCIKDSKQNLFYLFLRYSKTELSQTPPPSSSNSSSRTYTVYVSVTFLQQEDDTIFFSDF